MAPRRVTLVGLVAGGHGGVPRYAAALSRALDAISREFSSLELSLLTTHEGAEVVSPRFIETRTPLPRSRVLRAGPGRIIAEHVLAAATRSDLLHFFDLAGPVFAPRHPFVATIHDVSMARGYSALRQSYKFRLYPWALRRARAVVAISKFAKDEAVRLFDVDGKRLHVIHSGPGFSAPETLADPWGRAPEGPYLLFVGNLTASKNLPFLVRAFTRAQVDARLVLVGKPSERFEELSAAIAASPAGDRIDLRHDVEDEELDQLYRGATALVLPSHYEGFALTPLEAMVRGCPVLASDIPAVREVSGAGAWLLPVDDEAQWSAAIVSVISDRGVREDLRRKGASAVLTYSWEETARAVCRLFLEVLESEGR